MSSKSLFRRLTTKAFRTRKAATISQPGGRVGRRIEELEDRAVPATSWNQFNGNPQHTGISTVAAQPTDQILWQTSLDQQGGYFWHTGEPVFTPNDTVIVPIILSNGDTFELEAFNGATGALLWTGASSYIQPSYSWLPPYQPVYDPVTNRVYYAGPGGTLYYISNPDNPGSSTPTPSQVAFYGTSNYTSHEAAYNSSIYIDTPLTVDNSGNIFFGFEETGSNPSGINDGGIGRVSATGAGAYVTSGAAVGTGSGSPALGSAPALSNNDSTLYVAINDSNGPYLVGVNATTLAPQYSVALSVPNSGTGVELINVSTAAPMVAPDGTVFMGVFADSYDGSRGLMTHYSANLATEYTPGAFGWDDTASIIPTSMVPSYTGSSSYLILTKYNNYVAGETGSSGGNGVNEIAVLDPYATQKDPNNDPNPSMLVMKQVLTVTSPTEDSGYINGGYPDATREWCTNGTAVDPATDSVFINNEDGYNYRWNLATNSITQAVEITNGYGEPYTPTTIGPNGEVYAINGGSIFALGGYSNYTLTNISSLTPADVGQSVTFTTTLASTDSGAVPTGSITYSYTSGVNNPLNSTPVTLGTMPLVNGQATFTTSALVPDHYHITATYSGDATDGYAAGSTTMVQVILANPTTTVTSSAATINVGQSVTFTATVNPEGAFFVPLGTVSFMDGTTLLGTVTLNPLNQSTSPSSSQVATFSTSSLPAGNNSITAVYSGDLNFVGNTSSPYTQAVDQAPTITSVASTTFIVGTPGSFTVTAAGFPASMFTETGTLPGGVTLSSAGLLSGTPAPGSNGTYNLVITASNGVSPVAQQSFTLTVNTSFQVPLGQGGTFDFQPPGSSTQPGFDPVYPTDTPTSGQYASYGDGWLDSGAGAFDRSTLYNGAEVPNSPQLATLLETGEWGYPSSSAAGSSNDGEFQVTVAPNQLVQVTAYMGDTYQGRLDINVWVGLPGAGNQYKTLLNPSPTTFTTASQTYQYVSYSGMFNPGSSSTLEITFQAVAPGNFWTVSGLDVRPLSLIAPLTLTRTASSDGTSTSAPALPADGVSYDTYSGSGATPYAELTVNPQYGTLRGTDADPSVAGFQVQANAAGNFTFQITRPALATPSIISLEDVVGASATGIVGPTGAGPLAVSPNPYTLSTSYTQTYAFPPPPPASPPATVSERYDFTSGGSPTQSGFLSVPNTTVYSTTIGYGWQTAVNGYDRGAGSVPAGYPQNLYRAGAWGEGSGTFEVPVPLNSHEDVRVYVGDPYNAWSGITVTVDGTTMAVGAVLDRYGFVTLYNMSDNGTGLLNITISGPVWVVSGMDVATTGDLPTPATGLATTVTSARLELASTAIGGFTAVSNTTTYTPTSGYGWQSTVNSFVRPTSYFPTGSTLTATQMQFYGSGAWGQGSATFEFAVPLNSPSTTYSVRAYVSDPYDAWGGITLSGEGAATSPPVTASIGQSDASTTTITLTGLRDLNGDGIITLTVTGQVWVLNGLEIVQGGTGNLPAQPQSASVTGPAPGAAPVVPLTAAQLAPIAAAAVARWEEAGITPAQDALLKSVQYSIGNLSAQGALGLTGLGSTQVQIDATADGRGWFIDPTPNSDSEFTQVASTEEMALPSTAAAGHYDLLTVVEHELGHVLGLIDLSNSLAPTSLMATDLSPGVRRVPDAAAVSYPSAPVAGLVPVNVAVSEPVTIGSTSAGASTAPQQWLEMTPTALAQPVLPALPRTSLVLAAIPLDPPTRTSLTLSGGSMASNIPGWLPASDQGTDGDAWLLSGVLVS